MGIRFRRSKKIGPVRINMSGSGIGWSIGGKHFRYTQPAKGKAYTTTSLPGTGISYRETVQDSPKEVKPARPKLNAFERFVIITVIVVVGLTSYAVERILSSSDDSSASEPTPEEQRQAVLADLAESISARDFPDQPHELTLSAGHYWVQTDIPGGSCVVTRLTGQGNVLGEAYDEPFFVRMGDDPDAENTLEFPGMTSGWLTICGPLTVTVKYDRVNFPAADMTEHPEDEIELTEGVYTVDDLGTSYADYILTAVSGSGEVSCGDPKDNGLRERMSVDPENGIPSFHHFEIDLYDTLTITGGLVLRLTPITYTYNPVP